MGKIIDLTGRTIQIWYIIKRDDKRDKNKGIIWQCRCNCCDSIAILSTRRLRSQYIPKCQNCQKNKTSLIGVRFGKWIVLSKHIYTSKQQHKKTQWKCQCDCGTLQYMSTTQVKKQKTKQCRCCYYNLLNNLIGQKFDKWTVIQKVNNAKLVRHRSWLCKCMCGNTQVITTGKLKSDTQRPKCKTCHQHKSKHILQKGQQFGLWTVITEDLECSKRKGKPYWRCVCDCGNELSLQTTTLINNRSVQCNKCKCKNLTWKGYKDIPKTYFSQIHHSAALRNIGFYLTIKDLWNIFIKQKKCCNLSGVKLTFKRTYNDHKTNQTASLDRIDSSKPYTIDNIQWIHKDINWMKGKFAQNQFIEWCRLIVNNQKI